MVFVYAYKAKTQAADALLFLPCLTQMAEYLFLFRFSIDLTYSITYELLNRISSQIAQVSAASGLAKEFRIVVLARSIRYLTFEQSLKKSLKVISLNYSN